MKRLFFVLFNYFLFTVFLFGCSSMRTYNVNTAEIGTYPQPLVEALPLKVGAYYGEDFRKFDTIQEINIPNTDITRVCKITLEKANIALFDYILSQAFEKVTHVQHLPENPRAMKDIDLIIEPTVSGYSYSVLSSMCLVHIRYVIKFHTPDGVRIRPWLIEGNGSALSKIEFKSESSAIVELTQMAMRQVAANFMTGLCNQTEIKELFYNHCNK